MKSGNEKVILAVLIAIVVVWGNYFGYNWLAKKQKLQEVALRELLDAQRDATADLQDEDNSQLWSKRLSWIEENEPPGGDEAALQPQVLEAVRKAALDNKLDFSSPKIDAVQSTPAGTRVNVTITVKGPMEPLCKWLAALQQPENFYAVSSFSLKVDPDDDKAMLCTVQLGRYFKGGS